MNNIFPYLKYTILGCGSSCGVPRPNADWGACDPAEPKNRRTRTALLIEKYLDKEHKTTIIIDTGPDFAYQMLRENIRHIDAVLYTHSHADHTHGIDDLRSYALAQKVLLPIYGEVATLDYLQHSFGYCFKTPASSNYPPILQANELHIHEPEIVVGAGGDIEFLPLPQIHGDIASTAFRIGEFAYCTDISDMPLETKAALQNLQILIIGALQYKPHRSHFSVAQALDLIKELQPKMVYFTHMHNELDYNKVKAGLPNNVAPAYDGMTFICA